MDVPPAGQDFSLPDKRELLAWIPVKYLRPEQFGHPENTSPGSMVGLTAGRAVVDAFKARLEALRGGIGLGHLPRIDVSVFVSVFQF